MSSDADYAAFLDKANQDTGAGNASTAQQQQQQKHGQAKTLGRTTAVNAAVPKSLEAVEEYYVSEADEPFEPVSLKWDGEGAGGGSMPSADDFASLIGHDAEVSEIKQKEFDPRGQYENVIKAVEEVGSGSVAIFRIHHGKTRAEYYVVSVDKKGGRIVGLKAAAVES